MARPEEFENHVWKDVIDADTLKLYTPYVRETFVGPRAALLAVDLYNACYRGGDKYPHELLDTYPSTLGIYAQRTIEPTKRLFAAARAAGLPIIYCASEKEGPNRRPPRAVTTKRRKGVGVEPDDFDIHPAFAPQPDDIVIRKQRASCFNGTPLLSHLNILGISSLIACGASTSGCLRASLVDAHSYGFHVSLAAECAFDRSEINHKVNLFDMAHKYVDVMHVDEIVDHLNGLAYREAAE